MKFFFSFLFYLVALKVCGQSTDVNFYISTNDSAEVKLTLITPNLMKVPDIETLHVGKNQLHKKVNAIGTIFLGFETKKNRFAGFAEPGDTIVIQFFAVESNQGLKIFGKNTASFKWIDSIDQLASKMETKTAENKIKEIKDLLNLSDSLHHDMLQKLNNNQSQMSKGVAHQLNAYLDTKLLRSAYQAIISIYGDTFSKLLQDASVSLAIRKQLQALFTFRESNYDSFFYTSYLSSLLPNYYSENFTNNSKQAASYTGMAGLLPEKLRDAVMYQILSKTLQKQTDTPELVQAIHNINHTPEAQLYQNALFKLAQTSKKIKVGESAPDFKFEDTERKVQSLADFAHKVVIMDFWFAACVPCQTFFQASKALKAKFDRDPKVVFLNVSVDSRSVWLQSIKHQQLTGTHVFTAGSYRNHSSIKDYQVLEYPTVVVIGANGKILYYGAPPSIIELEKAVALSLKSLRP